HTSTGVAAKIFASGPIAVFSRTTISRSPFGPFSEIPPAAKNESQGKSGASCLSCETVIGLYTLSRSRFSATGQWAFAISVSSANTLSARACASGTFQPQHGAEILAIGFPRRNDILVVAQIVIAVGHSQPALHEVERISIGMLVFVSDTDTERRGCRQCRLAHGRRHIFKGLQACQIVEVFLRRFQSALFDLLLIHEGVVEVAQLLLF